MLKLNQFVLFPLVPVIQFEKHRSGPDLKRTFALHVFVLLCLLWLLQTISISLLQLQAFMLRRNTDANPHSVLFVLFSKRCCDRNSTCFPLNSNSLPLLFILHFLLFTSSPCLCEFLPVPLILSSPLFSLLLSQRRSWTWTRANGRTFTSSQELWNFSFASYLSPWCRSASSPTSWRQSVSDQLQSHSDCLFHTDEGWSTGLWPKAEGDDSCYVHVNFNSFSVYAEIS